MTKKSLLVWTMVMLGLVLPVQGQNALGKQDVMAAFEQYNAAALERAKTEPAYQDILTKLITAYSAPDTEANRTELIALVKNFDNSLLLQAVRNNYIENRTLQKMTGTSLAALDKNTIEQLVPVVKDIYKNTLAVKDIQIRNYKQQIKSIKKADLSAQQKESQIAVANQKIVQLKREKSTLKKNSKQKIRSAAEVYFEGIRSDFANPQQ